uniref:AlNc14C319G10567 protein n=1 Tax=Albugo laibachii Nc14 TaxID=890382 RepID=F0WWD4_9STRA|nr:AlNc14C319G10567 [Albugo laibachii Nc14]|eukprot:CCA25754.1 AlNc14C319G10567 [Albugo laibachii Nc14]
MTCQWIEYLNVRYNNVSHHLSKRCVRKGLLVQCNCPIIHFITTHEQDLNSASNPIIAHPNASFHVAIHSLLLNIMAISEDLQNAILTEVFIVFDFHLLLHITNAPATTRPRQSLAIKRLGGRSLACPSWVQIHTYLFCSQKMRWALEFFARYYCRFYVSLLDMPHKSPK